MSEQENAQPEQKPARSRRTYTDWDLAVFDAAEYFSVIMFVPRRSKDRHEYEAFPDAVQAAERWTGPNGQQALIYAVSTAGRSVCLDRDNWPMFEARWKDTHR